MTVRATPKSTINRPGAATRPLRSGLFASALCAVATVCPAWHVAAQTAEVRTVRPERASAREGFRLPVVAEPEKRARLFARANGFVAERRVDIGDAVEAGDVLAVIDAPEVVRNHERAKAAVGQADARVSLAEANLERTAVLAGKDFASRAVLDDRRSQSNIAVADREAALAELRRFEELLAFRQVRAPFGGVVVARNVELGDLVVGDAAAGATPMFELARIEELRIVADVPQGALGAIRLGEDAKVTFTRFGNEAFVAKVARRSQSIDRVSGTMRVELTMSNPGGRLPAGLAGHVEFAVAGDGVTVPTSALTIRNGKTFVVTLDEGVVRFREVALGRDLGRTVEIREGLREADEVVLNPNALLRAGDRVAVKSAS
ncbi:efflux RND transporter periplasmic adaptor subunit [Methylobacterium oryzisoli]|uniref:efflux RND transporter periplasmic adaptor subunit n=1 Tax=Methylobacterium oryzisoli TaxID=3385502 RepID=UPI003891FF58